MSDWTPIETDKDRYVEDGLYWITIESDGKRYVVHQSIHRKLRDKLRPNALAYIRIPDEEPYLPTLPQFSGQSVPTKFKCADVNEHGF